MANNQDKGKGKLTPTPPERPSTEGDTSLSSRIISSATSLARSTLESGSSLPSNDALRTVLGSGHAEGAKSSPGYLSNASRGALDAEGHRDTYSVGTDSSGSSTTLQPPSPSFRTTGSSSSNLVNDHPSTIGSDADFARFANPYTSIPHTSSSVPPTSIATHDHQAQPTTEPTLTAATASARYWTPEDLISRPQDGADVLRLLEDDDDAQGVEDELEESLSHRNQEWMRESDTTVPLDPELQEEERGRQRAEESITLSSSTNPYLYDFLSNISSSNLTDGAAIQSYLSSNRYTEDVYGLPRRLREALDDARDEDEEKRDVAVRRLRMLQSHLFGGGGAGGARVSGGQVVIRDEDLDEIWGKTGR